MDWVHVFVIVQCWTDGCSLSCKHGAVVWQSGQLAAGCLTILEMAVDDRRCPHFLVHFGAISVDFIMWSLWFTILIELSLGFLSGDHAFTYSFNEVVSLGIIAVRSWWKVGCPQGADQFGIDLCRGHGLIDTYLAPDICRSLISIAMKVTTILDIRCLLLTWKIVIYLHLYHSWALRWCR